MTPSKSFTLADNLIKAIAIMDEKGRANEGYNSYMLWFEDWKALRSNIRMAWKTLKRCETTKDETCPS